MKFDKPERPVDRAKRLRGYLKVHQRYEILCNNGDLYEGTYNAMNSGEEDIEMLVENVRDKSTVPRFDGAKYLDIGISDIVEIRPV